MLTGYTFRLDVLERAVPSPMRPYLSTILSSLVDCYWLTTRTVRQISGVYDYYSFCHVVVRNIIYEMTPANFRGSTHLTIAEFAEKTCRSHATSSIGNGQGAIAFNSSVNAFSTTAAYPAIRTSSCPVVEGGEWKLSYRMLFAAYHYSLSGMPPAKTIEFLCKSCEAILSNPALPVSKVDRTNHPISPQPYLNLILTYP